MTNKEIVETLDNVGVILFDLDIKGKQCFQMSNILNALKAIRNEIGSRDKERGEDNNDDIHARTSDDSSR